MIRMTSRAATSEEITTIKESHQSQLSEFSDEFDNNQTKEKNYETNEYRI